MQGPSCFSPVETTSALLETDARRQNNDEHYRAAAREARRIGVQKSTSCSTSTAAEADESAFPRTSVIASKVNPVNAEQNEAIDVLAGDIIAQIVIDAAEEVTVESALDEPANVARLSAFTSALAQQVAAAVVSRIGSNVPDGQHLKELLHAAWLKLFNIIKLEATRFGLTESHPAVVDAWFLAGRMLQNSNHLINLHCDWPAECELICGIRRRSATQFGVLFDISESASFRPDD